MNPPDLGKLDDALARLLAVGHIEASQKLPVAIQSADGALDAVRDAVERSGGTVRHVLRPLNAVAAWLPVAAVGAMAALDFVEGIEVDRVMNVA